MRAAAPVRAQGPADRCSIGILRLQQMQGSAVQHGMPLLPLRCGMAQPAPHQHRKRSLSVRMFPPRRQLPRCRISWRLLSSCSREWRHHMSVWLKSMMAVIEQHASHLHDADDHLHNADDHCS